jgi:hypothetical protein
VGLSTIYRHANHNLHKIWLRMVDPKSSNKTACRGFLLVSCFIVGQNERPPVRANLDVNEDEDHAEQQLMDQ